MRALARCQSQRSSPEVQDYAHALVLHQASVTFTELAKSSHALMEPRPQVPNLFDDIPAELKDELVTVLLQRSGVRLERIVSRGQKSPSGFWYDQEEDEWVIVIKGAARLEIEEKGEQKMGPGDYVFLPAHRRHRVAWTDPEQETVWLAVFVSETGAAETFGG